MTTAREIMTGDPTCVGAYDSLADAARKMRDLDVGTLPICGVDNRLKGMITDRDIVVKCIAEGGDPNTAHVVRFAQGKPVTIGAEASVERVLQTMSKHRVRRLPVIDGHFLIGMVSAADVARHLSNDQKGELLGAIWSSPAYN